MVAGRGVQELADQRVRELAAAGPLGARLRDVETDVHWEDGTRRPRRRAKLQGYNIAVLPTHAPSPFRLLYDLRWMELGAAGGVEQATYELVDAVARLDRANRYEILAPLSACWEWRFPLGFRVERHASDRGGRPTGSFDLVHSACSYIAPDMMESPNVLTVQDLQHLHFPEFFTPADLQLRDQLYAQSARRARHVICASEFTRRDVHARFGVPLERMSTVWNIPSRVMWSAIAPSQAETLLQRMGVGGPFLLYPAQCWPHKNHVRAVEAYARAASSLPAGMRLVFTGRAFPADHPAALLIRERALEGSIVHLGFRSPREIRALMQRCTALFFPSLFEGFGMPVAEAIIAGRPVACSNVASLPEIAGPAALTFDPTDVDAMATALVEISTREGLREELARESLKRRSLFSSHLTALKTLAIYQKALAA
jgi:glycosyltransferase involved in cell wall biosynthesis